MRDPVKARLVLLMVLAALAVLAIAGCGGGGDEGGGADPATMVPPNASVYVEATLTPQGAVKANVENLAKRVAGVDDLGSLIAEEVEKSAADSGKELDFAKDVESWLGEKAGLYLGSYDGADFNSYGVAIQTTDPAAAQNFIDNNLQSDRELEDASYEGVEYKIEPKDGEAVGVIDGFVLFGEDEQAFKAMVDASNGESLADENDFSSAISNAADGSIGSVFVDIGALIRETGNGIDPEAKLFLESAGIEPSEATAVASLLPGSDDVEIDFSTDLGGENAPSGDASELLGALPADSVAAFAAAEFGARFNEGIDRLDSNGIPGEVPPHKLKSALKEAGIDLEAIASSIDDVGLFVQGSGESSLGGALVLTTKNPSEAKNTVSNIGLFLRASGVPGVTAINGKLSGFSIRSPELGRQPLVIAAKKSRITVAYGLPAAAAALGDSGATLSGNSAYKEAVSALGGTPISGFVDGSAALRLASALVPAGEEGFQEAKPYLSKVAYLALGSEASGDLATAKLIVGFGK
jgi:hypothetical protein